MPNPRRILPALFGLTLAAGPVAAQDAPTSAQIIAAFKNRCAEIEADPLAAVNAAFGRDDDDAKGGVSSDKARMQLVNEIEIAPDFSAYISYIGGTFGGGTEAICTLSFSISDFGGANALADFADQAAAEAEAILGGPVTARGGLANFERKPGQLRTWAVETSFPPPAIMYFSEEDGYVSLSYVRTTPNTN